MQTQDHQPRSSSTPTPEESLRIPAELEGIAPARERAFQRLYEGLMVSRAVAEESREMHRRDFIRTISLGAITAAGLGSTIHTMLNARAAESVKTTENQSPSIPLMFGTARVGSFIWENILFQVGQWAFTHIAHEHKLPVGNASMASSGPQRIDIERVVAAYEKDPSQSGDIFLNVGIVGPIVEEMMFRVLPSLMTQSPGMQWQVGIPFNVIYALMHSVVPEDASAKLSVPISATHKISLDHLPISQFMLGAFCWYCARSYGTLAPILTHTLNNHIPALVLAWGGKHTYEQFQTLLAEELAREQGDTSGST
jgi:hypothetical protein